MDYPQQRHTLTQVVKPVQKLSTKKTLTFQLHSGGSVTATMYSDRHQYCPMFDDSGKISNICLGLPGINTCTRITLVCHPVPYVLELDNQQAGSLFKAILVSIDGVHLPNFNNPVMFPPQHREYICGNGDTEHIVIIRNCIHQHICTTLYIHAALTIDWIRNEINMRGKTYESPRVMYFQGDDNAADQTYSGVSNSLSPWDAPTKKLRDMVKQMTGMYFNAGLYNYYTDGTRYIAEHADKEALDGNVWGLIMGGARDFHFRRLADKKIFDVKLNHGDVIQMRGLNIQKQWHHGIPKRAQAEPRISITFRWVGYK